MVETRHLAERALLKLNLYKPRNSHFSFTVLAIHIECCVFNRTTNINYKDKKRRKKEQPHLFVSPHTETQRFFFLNRFKLPHRYS